MPSAKFTISAVIVLLGLSSAAYASPLIARTVGLFEPSQRFEPVRWRYRYYRRGSDDDARQYELQWRRDATVQSSDPAIEMLRSNNRRGGRWIDPPAPR